MGNARSSKISCFYLIVNKMKLLLDGKPRNIYFRKDNTAYYKSNSNENDITEYFKKTGELKKQYINLLVENDNDVLLKKGKKMILGGVDLSQIFDPIIIENKIGDEDWDLETYKDVCTKLIYILILIKIQIELSDNRYEYDNSIEKYNKLIEIIIKHFFSSTTRLGTFSISSVISNIGFDNFFKMLDIIKNYNADDITKNNIKPNLIKENIFN